MPIDAFMRTTRAGEPQADPELNRASQWAEQLAHAQEIHVGQVSYRGIQLNHQRKVFDHIATESRKPIRGFPGNSITDLLRITSAARRRDMTPAVDHHLRSMFARPSVARATYRHAGSFEAAPSYAVDAVASLTAFAGYKSGSSVWKNSAVFGGSVLAAGVVQIVMAYVQTYTLLVSEENASEGMTSRSKTIKDVGDVKETIDDMNLAAVKAKYLGVHAVAWEPTETSTQVSNASVDFGRLREPQDQGSIVALEDAEKNLVKAIHNYYVSTGDEDNYFDAKKWQSVVNFARSCVSVFMTSIVRLVFPRNDKVPLYTLGATIALLFIARTISVTLARRDTANKRFGSHALTLDVTPLDRPADGEVSVELAATWLPHAAIRMDHAKMVINKRLENVAQSMAAILRVQPQHIFAYERAGGLEEMLLRSAPLTDEEQGELDAFRQLDTRSTSDMPRAQVLRWAELERYRGEGLDPALEARAKELDQGYKTSSMSGSSWKKANRSALQLATGSVETSLVAPHLTRASLAVSAGDSPEIRRQKQERVKVGSLTVTEFEYRAASPDQVAEAIRSDRAAVSLTPREHALRIALRARRGGFQLPEQNDLDYITANKAHFRLRELANRNLDLHGDEIRTKLGSLRRLAVELTELRYDLEAMNYDWDKTSDPTKAILHKFFVSDDSSYRLAIPVAMARAGRLADMLPSLYARLGGALHLVVFGSQFPTLAPAALKVIGTKLPKLVEFHQGTGLTGKALGFTKVRFAIQAILLQMVAVFSVQGVPGLLNKRIRRQLNPKLVKSSVGKDIPTAKAVASMEAGRTFVYMYFEQCYLRLWSGPLSAAAAEKALKDVRAVLTKLRADHGISDETFDEIGLAAVEAVNEIEAAGADASVASAAPGDQVPVKNGQFDASHAGSESLDSDGHLSIELSDWLTSISPYFDSDPAPLQLTPLQQTSEEATGVRVSVSGASGSQAT